MAFSEWTGDDLSWDLSLSHESASDFGRQFVLLQRSANHLRILRVVTDCPPREVGLALELLGIDGHILGLFSDLDVLRVAVVRRSLKSS